MTPLRCLEKSGPHILPVNGEVLVLHSCRECRLTPPRSKQPRKATEPSRPKGGNHLGNRRISLDSVRALRERATREATEYAVYQVALLGGPRGPSLQALFRPVTRHTRCAASSTPVLSSSRVGSDIECAPRRHQLEPGRQDPVESWPANPTSQQGEYLPRRLLPQ